MGHGSIWFLHRYHACLMQCYTRSQMNFYMQVFISICLLVFLLLLNYIWNQSLSLSLFLVSLSNPSCTTTYSFISTMLATSTQVSILSSSKILIMIAYQSITTTLVIFTSASVVSSLLVVAVDTILRWDLPLPLDHELAPLAISFISTLSFYFFT